jgi:putative oxidoreductase
MLEPFLQYTPYLALFLRVIVGCNLIIHSRPKFSKMPLIIERTRYYGAPAKVAYAITVLESVGGLFLILGFIVPVVALLLVIEFTAIIIAKFRLKGNYIHGESPLKYEIDLLYFLFAITLLVVGAGAFSIDSYLGL